MSNKLEVAKLRSLRTGSWIVFGVSTAISFIAGILATLNGIALSGCRFIQGTAFYLPTSTKPCDTGPTDAAVFVTLVTGIIAIVSGTLAIVFQIKLSAKQAKNTSSSHLDV